MNVIFVYPLVAIIISFAESISLYLIRLFLKAYPSWVEYYHSISPLVLSKLTVLFPFDHENAYKKLSFLPNTNPRCPQSFVPLVYFIQSGELEKIKGSNLNRCCPSHDDAELLEYYPERTYALATEPELTAIDLAL